MINLSALKENIDLEIEASKKESSDIFRCGMLLAEIVSEALEQQIASDVVKVVRCKDCADRDSEGCPLTYWNGGELVSNVDDNDFCSGGRRRTRDE